jgi:hypothetical protein
MITDISTFLPENFHPHSRVWIYQSSRQFLISEAFELEDMLKEFLKAWNSHGVPVKGFANLFHGRFLVFMADESAGSVSGCSTDSSVRLVKEIEKKFKVDLFDRQLLAFIVKEKIQVLPISQLKHALENNFIQEDDYYFNNLVSTKKELEDNWIIPLKVSWLSRFLPTDSSN